MTDTTSGKVPVFACVRQAWEFLLENWRLFLPAAAIVAVVAQVGPVLAAFTAPQATQPQSVMQNLLGDILIYLPSMIASLLYSAAILRKAVRNEVTGQFGLTFGADEVRLIGVAAAMACLFIPLISLVVIVLAVTVFSKLATSQAALEALLADPDAMNDAIIAAVGEGGAAAISLFIIFMFAVFVVLAARLYMVNAATIGERRMVIFQTWSWSNGNVLRVLGAMILTVLPVMLIDSVVNSFGLTILASIGDGREVISWLLVRTMITFVGAITTIPVVALGAIIYKGLRPQGFVPK
ncbi:MAG: hypothetical protein EOP61_11885 [Sphingomonadales bacterium]|nr:MAG: hypothetical protein EOP61_11885 [Sphingomonadales bacterium]